MDVLINEASKFGWNEDKVREVVKIMEDDCGIDFDYLYGHYVFGQKASDLIQLQLNKSKNKDFVLDELTRDAIGYLYVDEHEENGKNYLTIGINIASDSMGVDNFKNVFCLYIDCDGKIYKRNAFNQVISMYDKEELEKIKQAAVDYASSKGAILDKDKNLVSELRIHPYVFIGKNGRSNLEEVISEPIYYKVDFVYYLKSEVYKAKDKKYSVSSYYDGKKINVTQEYEDARAYNN